MLDWLYAALLGLIEGVTEFIPVSSTGHLLLAEQFLPRQTDLFNVVIQCGAVIAVIPLFWARIRSLLLAYREPAGRDYLLKLMLAFGITAVGGLLLQKGGYELPESALPVALALLIGGIAFLAIEHLVRGREPSDRITWTVAVLMGVGQLIAAVFPGASRSGSTILLALLVATSRPAATEFSFILGVPTILAAGGVKILKAFSASAPVEHWDRVAIGTLVSALVSFVVVRWFLRYVRSHSFSLFGWYRIALGLIILAAMTAH
ncbi:MAG TPA: undecaprenyl-diphosphate phosphatase [Polyangiaceae bacterium]|nr:undecaprenyl-diphosphate phosphatase [Polyangiaceae bacterium]